MSLPIRPPREGARIELASPTFVPTAGLEPTLFSFVARRFLQLSYAGMSEREYRDAFFSLSDICGTRNWHPSFRLNPDLDYEVCHFSLRAPGGTRIPTLLVRSQMLSPIKLQAHGLGLSRVSRLSLPIRPASRRYLVRQVGLEPTSLQLRKLVLYPI